MPRLAAKPRSNDPVHRSTRRGLRKAIDLGLDPGLFFVIADELDGVPGSGHYTRRLGGDHEPAVGGFNRADDNLSVI